MVPSGGVVAVERRKSNPPRGTPRGDAGEAAGAPKGLSILGSTGSIGRSALDIVRRHPGRFKAKALSAGNNIKLLKRQISEFRPRYVSVLTEKAALEVKRSAGYGIDVGCGAEGAARAASFDGVDICVSAISGSAGLLPTLAAVKAGIDVALANKEALVMAGNLVMAEAARSGSSIMPVDSEHSAVFQSLSGHRIEDVKRIILTASGGPFLDTPLKRLPRATPEEALKHPRWSMGRKITIDSATLMNKGFEVIEARWLFDQGADKITVAIHPQSIVHSMVEYIDGSIVAQMGSTDMRGPIAYALSYPERIESGAPKLSLKGLRLDFLEPEKKRFPCLNLAYDALMCGGAALAALNAADEVAVEEFLKGAIAFTDIYRVIATVLERCASKRADTIDEVLDADRRAREAAMKKARALS
ncbi:MAG: 1-deoxy-D-xylulose-5-phosphate reductoisomerase [Deltaproteobacteria bacterium]|nr:1-deoxy-D-xylulose-5-phosphate reductoisomerase [Deltaproteobacteria bacterium]